MTLDTHKPLISVVIPSFNHAKWIGAAIDSVILQTYKNFELLIIDNNSTDFTDDILANYSDIRIRVVKVENLGSIAFSRNRALDLARGEWIAFLDSDDIWDEDKLEKCAMLFNKDTDLIYHHLRIISESKQSSQIKGIFSRPLKQPVFLDLLLNGNTIATSSVVVRTKTISRIKGMREELSLSGVEDYNTWIRISRNTDKFKLVDKYLGGYRLHQNNASSRNDRETIWNALVEFIPELSNKQVKEVKANLNYTFARRSYLDDKSSVKIKDLISVLKSGRFSRRIRGAWMIISISKLKSQGFFRSFINAII
jgi:glycosyltransferase involved in cell wall biosynthesis